MFCGLDCLVSLVCVVGLLFVWVCLLFGDAGVDAGQLSLCVDWLVCGVVV